MRTKALICAAAVIAAGLATSNAQVFSVNIVGYVNTVVKGSNALTLLANPLDDGTNTANSILAAMPNKTQIQTWNGVAYVSSTKASGSFSPNTSLPPGTGFFIKLPTGAATASLTNTFVGNVIPNSGGTNTVTLTNGLLTLVGSRLSVGGLLNDTGINTLNLNATVPNKTQVQVWDNSGLGAYTSSTKASGAFAPNLPISVGQGFFINSKATTNWTQTLQ